MPSGISVVDVVLRGTFNTCRSAARLMRRGRDEVAEYHRKVVNISSTKASTAWAATPTTRRPRPGVIGLTKSLAREWGPQRINVNAIAPGYIEGTRLTQARAGGRGHGYPRGHDPADRGPIPIGRGGTAEDVADLVAFLSSPQSDYLTGQVIELHGGLEIISIV